MKNEWKYFLFALLLTVTIFVVEIFTPLGYIEWLLYIVPLLITIRTESWIFTIVILALSTLFVVSGLFLSPEGVLFTIALQNRIFGMIAISTFAIVIVNLQHTKKRLNSERELLQTIYDKVPVMFTIYDPQIKRVQMNKEIERVTGWTDDDDQKVGIMKLAYPDPAYREMVEKYMMSLQTGFKDLIMHCKNGITIETIWANIKIPDGRRVGIGLNISERKKMEKDLQRRTLELTYANKELETFAYSVSHDLRSPINSIKMFAEILIKDYSADLDENALDCIRRIIDGTDRANTLINDILALSKVIRQEITLKKVDLGNIASNIIADLKKSEPNRDVSFDIQNNMNVFADEHMMKIALANILGNAWKYTSKKIHACIEFKCFDQDEERVFFVRDNGIGFDMMNGAQKIFEPFVRLHTDSEFKGTGVGLATVERIIKKHNGRVWAEGTPGVGATFYFTLPNEEKVI